MFQNHTLATLRNICREYRTFNEIKSYSKLNIPSDERVHLAIIIGYGDEKPEVHKRKKDNVFYI